jgi:hypothetical protein
MRIILPLLCISWYLPFFFRRVVLQSKVAMDIPVVISVASIVTHFLTKIYHFTRSINWMING